MSGAVLVELSLGSNARYDGPWTGSVGKVRLLRGELAQDSTAAAAAAADGGG